MYYHEDDRREFVRHLAARFPKCFSDEPSHRRPLKHNIINDLTEQKVLDREKLVHALNWYTNHFVYRYGLLAGAERVDLDGKKAGTVTPKEEQEARAWVAARKKEMAERAVPQIDPPPRPAATRELNGHEHIMTKTTTTYATNGAAAAPSLHPSLVKVQEAITIASSVLTEKQFEPLRSVLATAALQEIIGKAETLIGWLQRDETQP